MTVKQQIPEVQGIDDEKVSRVLLSMKAVIDRATGRFPNVAPIKQLGPNATLAGVINKVNEIIKRLQEE